MYMKKEDLNSYMNNAKQFIEKFIENHNHNHDIDNVYDALSLILIHAVILDNTVIVKKVLQQMYAFDNIKVM